MAMEKKFHTHNTHWEIMVNFMEEHLDFARGQYVGMDGKKKNRELWDGLVEILNSAGLGLRSREKWQKAWTDLKAKIKSKAAAIRFEQHATGGGSQTTNELTALELRVVNIIGSSCFEGTNNPERGLPTNVEVESLPQFNSAADESGIPETSGVKRKNMEEALFTPKKNKKEETLSERVCIESLELLAGIKKELSMLNNTFKDLVDILKKQK